MKPEINLFLILHEVSCGLLWFTVFCRMVHTSADKTRVMVRFAFWMLGTVAMLGMAWPIYGWPLAWFSVLLTFTMVYVQLVTAHFWYKGAPWQFKASPESDK